jgi:hypothetical protein
VSGTRWQEARKTIDELLWSILPKQTPEERKRLVALVPVLIKQLNAELDVLQVSAEERAPFLDACFDLQTAALRNRADLPARTPMNQTPPSGLAAPGTAPDKGIFPAVEILEREGKLVQYFGSPATNKPTWRSANTRAVQGDWIAFQLPDEEKLCGRHCGEVPDSGSVLLFNTDWGYAAALDRTQLEQQLADGNARILSATALFDEAAERALGQIARRAP